MEVVASPIIDAPVHAEGKADRPVAGAVPGAPLSEWHNYLGPQQEREGEPCQAPSSPTLSSTSCNAQPVSEEACSRPQDEQRERRPMSRPGHSSIRSSMSDGSSTMRLSGCFQHRVRFCDEEERPVEVEDGMGSFSAAFNPTTTGSLFMGSSNSSRGMAVPRVDISKVIPTILLNGAGRSTMMPRLDTSKVVSTVTLESSSARQNRPPVSSRSPRNTPPPPSSSSRAPPQQRTTPRSNSASSFGSTNNTSTAASPRPGAVHTTPRSAKDSAAAPTLKNARPNPARPAPPSFQATSGSMSARKTTVVTTPRAAAVAAETSMATAALASASVGIKKSIAAGSTGSRQLTPRGSTTSSNKAPAKASSANPLPVPTAVVQAASSAQPTSKPIPVPVGRQVSGKRSSTVAGGGALVSAPSKLPWSSTIGVRPPSQAFSGNISQLQESPRLPEPDRRARPSATGSDFRFNTSEQPSSSPGTPAKVGSFAHRHQATAGPSPAKLASGVSRVRNWVGVGADDKQPRDDSSYPATEAGQEPEPKTTHPAELRQASDHTEPAPEFVDTDSVTLEVQQHEASDVWALDNRTEEAAAVLQPPQKAALPKTHSGVSSPAKATPAQRLAPSGGSVGVPQPPRTATARSTAVIDGTAAAWSPESKPTGTSSAARFIPASLQLHDVDLAKKVEAAAVSKALVLELVKMVVEGTEEAKLKKAEQLAAAEAAKKGGKMVPAGDKTDRQDSPVPIKTSMWGRLCHCFSPV